MFFLPPLSACVLYTDRNHKVLHILMETSIDPLHLFRAQSTTDRIVQDSPSAAKLTRSYIKVATTFKVASIIIFQLHTFQLLLISLLNLLVTIQRDYHIQYLANSYLKIYQLQYKVTTIL